MPGITGIDATIKIRKGDSKVKIILLTLDDSQYLIQKAFHAGVNGCKKSDPESGGHITGLNFPQRSRSDVVADNPLIQLTSMDSGANWNKKVVH